MKNRILGGVGLAFTFALLPGCLQRPSNSAEEVGVTAPDPAAEPAEPAQSADPSDAAFSRVQQEQPAPTSLSVTPAVSEVVKLAAAGVKEGVLLAFVERSERVFNLGAEEIIYLNDLGVPPSVVTAMIKRDAALRDLAISDALARETAGTSDESASGTTIEQNKAGSSSASSQKAELLSSVSELAESDSIFHGTLSPYGNWVDIDGYGQCWQPTVASHDAGWQPYFDGGHWVYTEGGWYWLSDYSWGWAPFHYGRWFQHRYLGWCWQPDAIWGPAWVSWRYDDDYCGWAPLPPSANYRKGAGLVVNGRSVGSDYSFGLTAKNFVFIPFRHFRDRQLRSHSLPRDQIAELFDHTMAVTRITGPDRTVVNHGIPPTRIAFFTGAPVQRTPLSELHPTQPRPGQPGIRTSGGTLAGPHAQPPLPSPQAPATAAANVQHETYPPNSLILIGRRDHTNPRLTAPSATHQTQGSPMLLAETDIGTRNFEGEQVMSDPPDTRNTPAQTLPNQSSHALPAPGYPFFGAPLPSRQTGHPPQEPPTSSLPPRATDATHSSARPPQATAAPANHAQPASRADSSPPQAHEPAAPPHQPPPPREPAHRPEPPPASPPPQPRSMPEPPPPPRPPATESRPAQPPPPPPAPAQSSSSSSSRSGSEPRQR